MVTRLSVDARKIVLTSATEEARRRGDRRLGTDHLLLGLLHDVDSPVAQAIGIDLESARTAADTLDREALAAVGVNVAHLGESPNPVYARRLLPLTSGARSVLKQTLLETRTSRTKNIETRHFLLALLDRERPDPAAELLDSLGVDRLQVRSRLQGPSD